MKIRLSGWQEDAVPPTIQDTLTFDNGGAGADESGSWPEYDGLIGFFEEKMCL